MIEKKQYTKSCPICHNKIVWLHGCKLLTCPFCGAIKWDKPEDECKLFNLQKKYLKTRDKNVLGDMYLILIPYARKTILKMLRGRASYDEDKLETKIQDTVTVLLSYFLRKQNFFVSDSFGQLLILGAHQQLHSKKQKDIDLKEYSYDLPMGDEDKNSFLSEIKDTHNPLALVEDISIEKDLDNFIKKIYINIYKSYGLSVAIEGMYLLHFYLIQKKLDFFDRFYSTFGTDKKIILEKEKSLVFEYIKELQETNTGYYNGSNF